MKRVTVFLLCAAILATGAFAQEVPGGQAQTARTWQDDSEERLHLAISSLEYPVTPGDIYRLTYRQSAGASFNQQVHIDGNGSADLDFFGKINANGMTFVQLKQKIEELISKNYTYSLPNLSIETPGIFRVCVRDGASRIRYEIAWGLSRLSEVVADMRTSQTSYRNVELIPQNGEPRSYDLMMASITNSRNADPLVRPGDTIMLRGLGKTVRVLGEVRRPGQYELKGAEGLKDLIEVFAGGLSNMADATRVRVDHNSNVAQRTEYLTLPEAYSGTVALNDGDTVIVRSRNEKLPLVWFEGAVSEAALRGAGGAQTAAAASTTASEGTVGRFSFQIMEGQKLSDILQDVRPAFLPLADLASATMYQPNAETGTAVNILALLSGIDLSTDVSLTAGCRISIPAVRTTVIVSGAVFAPGAFPHRQGANPAYYIGLAGGADPSRNDFGAYAVYDKGGKRRKASQPVQAGDRIYVRSNSFLYNLSRGVPIITSVVTMLTSLTTLAMLYFQFGIQQ